MLTSSLVLLVVAERLFTLAKSAQESSACQYSLSTTRSWPCTILSIRVKDIHFIVVERTPPHRNKVQYEVQASMTRPHSFPPFTMSMITTLVISFLSQTTRRLFTQEAQELSGNLETERFTAIARPRTIGFDTGRSSSRPNARRHRHCLHRLH